MNIRDRELISIHGHRKVVAEAWVDDPKQTETYDAIYFDPFAPEKNPELWTSSFLKRMYKLLKPRCRLVTYCVSRAVRSAMEDAGFEIQRVPGPEGGKREVLVATKLSSQTTRGKRFGR